MKLIYDTLRLSASDLANHLGCRYLALETDHQVGQGPR